MPSDSSTGQPADLSPALAELAAEPAEATAFRLWKAIEDDERRLAAEQLWEHDDPGPLARLIAETFNFREQTVLGWEPEKVAYYTCKLRPHEPSVLNQLLVRLHLPGRTDLLTDFLDHLGLPHDEHGQLKEEAYEFQISADQVHRACDKLVAAHPTDPVITYFLTLVIREDEFTPGLADWLEEFVGEPSAEVSEEGEGAQGADERESAQDEIVTGEFTTLDRQLIRTVVDVAQGIEGSLSEDELDDLVGELIQLNSDRHRSYFHAGFTDVVLDRPVRDELPAQNDTRLRWYWAGYITGLGRKERWEEIVAHYDEHAAVRDLGAGSTGPGRLAGRVVFQALCHEGRPGEAAEFVHPGVVVADKALLYELKRVGTRLLREDRAPEARGIFDVLGEAVDRLKSVGVDTTTRLFLEILRRRAHCYRQLGEASRARELLERLLENESSPEIRAMAQTDLGLIDGGFRRLSDLAIPDEEERQDLLREELEDGEDRFREAAGADVRYSAHGRFCLGVLELLRDRPEEATGHLDVALSVFESQPDRYAHANLLANARLYLATAISKALETGRNPRVADLVQRGLRGGGQIPPEYLQSILAVLQMTSDALAQEVAETVLEVEGRNRLDVLVDAEAALQSPAITSALLSRADDEERGRTARVADLRRVLPLLLEQGRAGEAAGVLDWLEKAARDGIGAEAFAELLEAPANYEPAWERQDALWARVQCLEATGQDQEAVSLLEKEFHRVLSDESFGYLEEAAGLLEKISTYGPPEERLASLQNRLEAERETVEPEEDEQHEARKVRILFVGGNETQEQYDEAIKEELTETGAEIEVTFQHPGWKSNWSRDLDAAVRELPKHDGVVLMRFMRTELGRQLRKEIDVPWRGCHGTGKRAIKDSIRSAAKAARRHLRRREREARETAG